MIFILGDYDDPSLSTQHRLLVNIDDENDCALKFSQLNSQFPLSNLSPIGFFIGRVQANDDDYSPNFRRIQYQILENGNQDVINIDPNNGRLCLAKQRSVGIKFNMTVIAILINIIIHYMIKLILKFYYLMKHHVYQCLIK